MTVPFGIAGSDGLMNGVGEVFAASERLVREMMPLQIAPNPLDGVELRGIFRQPLDREPGRAGGQRGSRRLAGVDRAVVENEPNRLGSDTRLGAVAAVDLREEGDEITAAFPLAGAHDQVTLRPVEGADQGDLARLAGGGNAQIGPLLGPDMGEVGMRERRRFVPEQQHDVTGLGLGFQQPTAQAGTINRVGILTPLQRVPRAPPAKAPFLRSTTDNREGEMRTPERCSISSANRGNVQFGRSATGVSRSACATASAQPALTGGGPGATRRRSAATPPVMNVLRHSRTVSSRTPKAWAMRLLVHPDSVNSTARARSASPRSGDWLSSVKACRCAASAMIGDLPAMSPACSLKHRNTGIQRRDLLIRQGKPA